VPYRPDVPAPAAATDTSSAEWLNDEIRLVGTDWVPATAGTRWPAYARVFHPLDDDDPAAPRWADIARQHGHTMHPGVDWNAIRSRPPMQSFSGRGSPGNPEWGLLRPHALTRLCEILRRHTTTPDTCWFALWEGWGWMHTAANAWLTPFGGPAIDDPNPPVGEYLNPAAPTFSLPTRTYLLYGGPIDAAPAIGHWPTPSLFQPQSPSLMWPNDHAWCLATEVDHDSTLIGGTEAMVAAVTDSPDLEAQEIAENEPRQDTVNHYPNGADNHDDT